MKLSRNVRLRLYRKKHYNQVRLNFKKNIYSYYIEMNNRKIPKTYNHSQSIIDRKLGDKLERKFETWLVAENWFNADFDLGKSPGWKELDYKTTNDEPKKIFLELKGRRVRKHQYPTTIIGHNKYIKARKMMMKGYEVYFFFQFKDRLCFWQVPMILPEGVEVKIAGTNKRGRPEYKDHLYIPIAYLYDVIDFPSFEYWQDRQNIQRQLKEQIQVIENGLDKEQSYEEINKKVNSIIV